MRKGQFTSVIVLLFLFLLQGNLNAQGVKANFSGTWIFNDTKSIFEEGRGFRSLTQIIVNQSGNKISVDRIRINLSGKTVPINDKYTLDGKECANTSSRGQSKTRVTWSADRKALNFMIARSFDWNGELTVLKSAEVWSLTDPNTLSIIYSLTMQDGEKKSTLVYDKK